MKKLTVLISCGLALAANNVFAETTEVAQNEKTLRIYLDADRSHNKTSAYSMERGFKTALSEVGDEFQGYKVELVPLDHRGNSARSKRNMEAFSKDPNALLILAGLHSPPLIEHKKFINENKILTLVPWAAAGPITRYGPEKNWVFRASVDDAKAGYTISDFAVKKLGCKAPHLLLEKTPWGDSNLKTMTSALKGLDINDPKVTRFGWNTEEDGARIKLRALMEGGTDCIQLVANVLEAQAFIKAMLALDEDKRIPIISHWGITGGGFTEKVTHDMREQFGLYFIQTCFSFLDKSPHPIGDAVFEKAKALFAGDIKTRTDIEAPTGFIHAYDLGKILTQAISQVTLSDDMGANREQIRLALEDIEQPVQGLVKRYEKPFGTFDAEHPDAHDALGVDDFCMAQYGKNNEILVQSK